ncbi:MAG: amidohydrolase family protein [Oscillospiraceae bacterium]|nr:amidohydrolase family protein [Oscillospiraceae bacterium]
MRILKGHLLSAASPSRLQSIPDGYLAADEDGILRYVGPQLPQPLRTLPVEDWGDRLILQSFADMHLHAPQYPMLGQGMDLPLLSWLREYAYPTEARFSDLAFARNCSRHLAAALIGGGTTRVCMFSSLHTDATLILMEELERAGISGYVGKVNMDRQGGAGLRESTEESMRETLRWLDACGDFRTVRPILTPRFTPACTEEILTFLGRLAAERGLYVQSHLSENPEELRLVGELCPDCAQYWETYQKHGLWRDHTVMAHCVYSDERERAAMREAGVLAVHCPDSNWNLCSGTAPVKTMLREGSWVALGSDIAGGAVLFLPHVAAAAIRASKVRHMTEGEDFLTVPEAYYLATSAGHRYFGDRDGFQVGNPLHAAVVDETNLPPAARELTAAERLERFLYLGDDRNLAAVYANGKKVK